MRGFWGEEEVEVMGCVQSGAGGKALARSEPLELSPGSSLFS